tara:strand:- start:39 stop:293 length:255 start_codon:yes stop_codon:yes gene_type:complete
MTLIKTTENDKIEIVGEFKAVQIRTAIVIKEDGKEISRSFHRHVVSPDMDISGETAEVQAICNSIWTDEIKQKYAEFKTMAIPQ